MTDEYKPIYDFMADGDLSSQVIHPTRRHILLGDGALVDVSGATLAERFTIVPSLVQLKALTHAKAAALGQVLVQGGASANDGQGRFYRWNATSVALDDNTWTVELDLGGTGRWEALSLSIPVPGYTVATLPSAANFLRMQVVITDRNGRPAWSNGTNWIFADGAVVS